MVSSEVQGIFFLQLQSEPPIGAVKAYKIGRADEDHDRLIYVGNHLIIKFKAYFFL
jgi:hypothetical protein